MMALLQPFVELPSWGTAITLAALAVTALAMASYLLSTKLHPQEPPVIVPSLPLLGHLLGMALHGGRYIKSIGYSCSLP